MIVLISCLPARANEAPRKLPSCKNGSFETFHINHGDASSIADLVGNIEFESDDDSKPCGATLTKTNINIGGPTSIEIYGNTLGRKALKQFIGSFDLPRERINLDLWAIQISSASPAQLADVMGQVQRQVDQTREAMQKTYATISEISMMPEPYDRGIGQNLKRLGFKNAIPCQAWFPMESLLPEDSSCTDDPKLSLTQLLLRLTLAADPVGNYNRSALAICNHFASQEHQKTFALFNRFEGRELKAYDVQRIFNDDLPRSYRRPFQAFLEQGLHQKFPKDGQPVCGDGAIGPDREAKERINANRRRTAIRDFAESYSVYRRNPTQSDPYALAAKAAIVDDMMAPVVNAINQDIEAYFIRPTLFQIRQVVGRNRSVEYAEVGRNTISGINGQTVRLSSGTTSSFDEPTPLRLGQWLTDARAELANTQAILSLTQPASKGSSAKAATLGSLFPWLASASSGPVPAVLSTLPLPNAISLLSALSKEEQNWQALSSGIDITMKPNLMRDQMQAGLEVSLRIYDPANAESTGQNSFFFNSRSPNATQNPKAPLSRISKSELSSKIVIDTMDLFALSSFNNHTVVTGRRWYVPLIGTIWEGAFGDIPVVGGWFSFKRPPQNKQHQSIILTNTLIVPSAMGMASYFSEN